MGKNVRHWGYKEDSKNFYRKSCYIKISNYNDAEILTTKSERQRTMEDTFVIRMGNYLHLRL